MEIKEILEKFDRMAGELVADVKRYADERSKELKDKVEVTLAERRQQLEKITRSLPKDREALRHYLEAQRSEFEKLKKTLLRNIRLAPRKIRKAYKKPISGEIEI